MTRTESEDDNIDLEEIMNTEDGTSANNLGGKWGRGEVNRAESLRRLRESASQFSEDLSRGWQIYRRSFLAMLGLTMVLFVSTIAIFADEIAVEHPYRNLQDTEDLWSIDYEPRRAEPFSEECDWREQPISLTTQRRYNSTTVVAETDDLVAEDNRYYRDQLQVIEIISLVDDQGYALNMSLISVDEENSSIIHINQELMDNKRHNTIWLTYEFNNEDKHHWWLPDGYDTCIFGTNNEGQDMFSKVIYGARVSLKIGVTVAFLTVVLGTVIGSISGYYGGRVDEVMMRITDVFFAVPGLILAMAFVAALGDVTTFTVSISFAVLAPALFMAFYLRSSLKDSLRESVGETYGATSRGASFVWMRILQVAVIGGIIILGIWSAVFGRSESFVWRVLSILGLVLFIGIFSLNDRRLLSMSDENPARNILGGLDWTDPYRYVTIRTVAIFASILLMAKWSSTSGEDLVVIKDFDKLWKIQAALIFTGWPGYARLIRGQVLYVKEMTFVEAARSVGAPPGRIMFRHILPNAWAPLLVAFTLDIGGTILSASGLSFIGLGAEPGTAEWGLMVSDGRKYFPLEWWLIFYPGIAIAITTLGFNLLGDGLRDVVDPKNRR